MHEVVKQTVRNIKRFTCVQVTSKMCNKVILFRGYHSRLEPFCYETEIKTLLYFDYNNCLLRYYGNAEIVHIPNIERRWGSTEVLISKLG